MLTQKPGPESAPRAAGAPADPASLICLFEGEYVPLADARVSGYLAFGEVGLAGEVRPAPRGQERLREAAKLGFAVAVVPKANAPKAGRDGDARSFEGLTIHAVERIEEAIDVVRSL